MTTKQIIAALAPCCNRGTEYYTCGVCRSHGKIWASDGVPMEWDAWHVAVKAMKELKTTDQSD